MKALLATVVFSLNTVLLIAQEMHAEADSLNFKRFEAEVSWFTPIGALKNYMNPTPLFGMWYRSQFSENSIINYGLQLSFPKEHAFEYANADFNSTTKSLAGNLGLRLDKALFKNNAGTRSLNWSTHFGYSFYFYDDVKLREEYAGWSPKRKEEEGEPVFIRPFSTFHIGQSIKLNINNVGLFAQYTYSPYHIFTKGIDRNFGSQHFNIGISYRQ